MNKKTAYTLSIVVLVAMLIPLFLILFKPKYSNVFEEIYHDEYYHATTSFLRTNSTLNSIPDMEKNRTRGLFYGVISEQYKKETLPENIIDIVYNFLYPEEQLKNGTISIIVNYKLEFSDILQISYSYEHESNLLKRGVRIFSDSFQKEYSPKQYFQERNLNVEDYFEISDKLLKEKLIPDWLRAYPSRFSKDNWGEVTIVEDSTGM